MVLGGFLIIISCSHLSLILFFLAKVAGWRYLEYLTLKGRLVFCWHHGGGPRGKGLVWVGDFLGVWGITLKVGGEL